MPCQKAICLSALGELMIGMHRTLQNIAVAWMLYLRARTESF